MYRRKRNGKPFGNWYITVAGVRTSAGTTDKERAKWKEDKENTEAWDLAHGRTIPTWDGACLKWMDDNPKLAETERFIHYADWWRKKLTGRRLESITPGLVNKLILEHRKGVSLQTRTKQNSTANSYVAFVHRVITHVSNLKPAFQVYPPNLGNKRWAPVLEWLKISAQLTEDERDIMTFTLASGQRESNEMFFEWAWLDGGSAQIPAGETKTALPYGIPLNKTALAVIERRRQAKVIHPKYVFTNAGKLWYTNAMLRALGRACKAAEVPYITVHGLRHTFGTWLARAGVPADVRHRLMGHATVDAHDGYIHYDVESLRPYSEVIDILLTNPSYHLLNLGKVLEDQEKKSA